jgi:CBS domain-containing protein
MAVPSILANTPLLALDAVVLDTETTGLDAKTARIIEIGLLGRGIDLSWSSLINPAIAIPAASTAIHHITDAMVAQAPGFAAIWPQTETLIGGKVVIGHSLGFDLAILKRECERAGLTWRAPVWLDTRFLAIILDARLPDFSLAALASWLGVNVTGAHRALGDCEATLAIFNAMIPRLRERGVRTLGEALAACRKLERMTEELARAGWSETPSPIAIGDGPRAGFDAYPFQHRVKALMSAPPLFASGDTSIGDALATLANRKISGLFIGDPAQPADSVGIITERDVLRAIAKDGPAILNRPAQDIANRPLVTIPEGAYAYRAIGRMARRNIRHLAVISEDTGQVTGALTQRDLLRMRAQQAGLLGDDVDSATDPAGLARAWAKLPAMARGLTQEGISATEIAGIVAREVGALTRRAAIFGEERMQAEGLGPPPCPYAVLVLGSAGRGESLLAMDQDNAIIFQTGAPDSDADRWFATLGRHLADILHEVGVPYCKGGVMAREPGFRGAVETWAERMETWLTRSSPQDLLNVDIVFDARVVHGDPSLLTGLMTQFRSAAADNAAFLKLLIASHQEASAPVSLFGTIKGDEQGRLDLKKHITSRAVAAARVLALRHGQTPRATRERLLAVEGLGLGGSEDLRGLATAYADALAFILRGQLADIAEGRSASNRVPLALLSGAEKTALKTHLTRTANIGETVRTML